MKRLLMLGLGLGLVAVALYALVGRSPAPRGEIDDASRAAMEEVLREAEREDLERR